MHALLGEDASSQIDSAWIAGVRKAWKKWASRAETFEGYSKPAEVMEYDLLLRAADAAKAYLEEGRAFVRALREDLLLNKGFWTRPAGSEGKPVFEGMKGKAITLLTEAEEALSDGLSKVDFWRNQTHPEHGYRRDETWKDQASFNQILRTISLAAEEAAKAADKVLSGKLLRHLSTLVTKSGKSGEPLDFGGYEPTTLRVGDVAVIFQDTPVDPARGGAAADPERSRHPMYRTDYVKQLKQAKALLDRRKLGFLWYGRFEVQPHGYAPVNQLGAHFGVGAEYYRQGDFIRIYSDPKNLAKLIVHELGHRYYYKFLSASDRGKFDEWFGKVAATSAYGATVSSEDFAEVFSDYVVGTDMTRDQIDRFKVVLGRSKRQESLHTLAVQGRALLERVESFSDKVIEKLRKDFLLLMKNVPKAANYAQAEALWKAVKTWNERFNTLIFDQVVKTLPDTVRERLGAYYPDLDAWVKSWEERVRSDCWKLYVEMRLPFSPVGTDYARKYKPDETQEGAYAAFVKERDKWASRVKRAAQKAWKTLSEYVEWLAKADKVQTFEVPSDDVVELEGFKTRIYGADLADWAARSPKIISTFKVGLRDYRKRASKVFPWLVRNQLPLELRFNCGLDWGGRYEHDHILVCAFAVDDPEKTVHVLAHEMGHHVWKVYLSAEAQRFWELAIREDRGELDLRKLADIWEREAPTGHLSDLENVLKSDPVLYLQVETLTHGHGNYGKSVFFKLSELKDLIAQGTVTYPVPNNPITAYAAKNPEEAFCEAMGYLVAYGPRSVLPLVRRWLRAVLPEARTEEALRGLTAVGRSLLEAAEGDCFRYAYNFVRKQGGTLIHAVVTHPWSGKRFPHAWVEKGGKVFDWQASQGLGKGVRSVEDFRELWKPSEEVSYSADEALGFVARQKTFGPWT